MYVLVRKCNLVRRKVLRESGSWCIKRATSRFHLRRKRFYRLRLCLLYANQSATIFVSHTLTLCGMRPATVLDRVKTDVTPGRCQPLCACATAVSFKALIVSHTVRFDAAICQWSVAGNSRAAGGEIAGRCF